MGLPFAISFTASFVVAEIVELAERIIKELGNLFGSLFYDDLSAMRGITFLGKVFFRNIPYLLVIFPFELVATALGLLAFPIHIGFALEDFNEGRRTKYFVPIEPKLADKI